MPVPRSVSALAVGILSLLGLGTATPAEPRLSEVRQAVSEIIAACAMGPVSQLKEPLSYELERFLLPAVETKSAKLAVLDRMLERLDINTEEARGRLASENARQGFFEIYFNCIRHQVSLKLKSFNIPLE